MKRNPVRMAEDDTLEVNWLVNKAMTNSERRELTVGGAGAQVTRDEAYEIKWLAGKVMSESEAKAIGLGKPSISSCLEKGWTPEVHALKQSVARALEIRTAVDAGWFAEDGTAAGKHEDEVRVLKVTDTEREKIAGYFEDVKDADDWVRLRAKVKAHRTGVVHDVLAEAFKSASEHRVVRKKLSDTEATVLDVRCRIADFARDRWVRGVDWNAHSSFTESRASQADAPAIAKIRPFMTEGGVPSNPVAPGEGVKLEISIPQCRKMGWHEKVRQRQMSLVRAYEIRKAVDADWFNENGSSAHGHVDDVRELGVRDSERKMVARYFDGISDVNTWSELHRASAKTDASEEVKARFAEVAEHKRLARPLSESETAYFDARLRVSPLARDRWFRGEDWDKHTPMTQSRVSQMDAATLGKIMPFVDRGADTIDTLVKEHGSVAEVPGRFLESYGLELTLSYEGWGEGKVDEWRKRKAELFGASMARRSYSDLSAVEQAENGVNVVSRSHTKRFTDKRAGVGRYIKHRKSVSETETRIERMDRADIPVFIGEEIGIDVVGENVLAANRLQRMEGPQGTTLEDIPWNGFRQSLIAAYGSVGNIPPQVLAGYGLKVELKHRGDLDAADLMDQRLNASERDIRPLEPRIVDMDEIEVPEDVLISKRKRRGDIKVPRRYDVTGAADIEEPDALPTPSIEPSIPAPQQLPADEAVPVVPKPDDEAVPAGPKPADEAVGSGPAITDDLKPAAAHVDDVKPLATAPPVEDVSTATASEDVLGKVVVKPPGEAVGRGAGPVPRPEKLVLKVRAVKQVPIPRMDARPIGSGESLDRIVARFAYKIGNEKAMMSAVQMDFQRVSAQLDKLPKVRPEDKDKRSFEFELRDKGRMLPACNALVKTQSTDFVNSVFDHLEESLEGFRKGRPHVSELPRIALYHIMAQHLSVSAGITQAGDMNSDRYLRVGREYDAFSKELEKAPANLGLVYQGVRDRYLNITRAIDPKIDGKLAEAAKIQLRSAEPAEEERLPHGPSRRMIEEEARRRGRRKGEFVRSQKPTGPLYVRDEPEDKAPREDVREGKTEDAVETVTPTPPQPVVIPSLSFGEFDDRIHESIRRHKQKNRGGLISAAKMHVPPTGAFKQVVLAGGDVKEQGGNMLTLIADARLDKTTVARKTMLKHLEESAGAFESGLLKFMEDKTPPEQLARMAMYRVVAHEVGYGENVSQGTDEIGKRWREVGERYEKLASDVPEGLFMEYAGIEDRYTALAKEVYPDLANQMKKK
ncbi:hypothetical protein ACFLRF_05615 [Candidatus Altiarchaeota archaeon]